MPTFYGKYEPPPAVARHRRLWLALMRAALPVSDQPQYARALIGLWVRFLDEGAVPSFEEFSTVTERLLDQLRDAAHDEHGRSVDDGRYLHAARQLQLAERLARDELASNDDP